MELIAIEDRNDKICALCGATKSVKYIYDEKTYCNRCILTIQKVVNAKPLLKD